MVSQAYPAVSKCVLTSLRRDEVIMNHKLMVIMAALLLTMSTSTFAADETPTGSTHKLGASLALALVPFIGGVSGPTTPLSDTYYSDTFDTGFGGRLELFYDWNANLRGQIGVVHNRWSGKFFTGGEFPDGAQFDDFSLTGLYIGLKVRFREAARLRPFILGNLGIVKLSSVKVTVNGNEIPYWSDTMRDYLDLGAGLEYQLTERAAVFFDVRLEVFGKPDSENWPIAEATGGDSLPITIGLDMRF